MRRTAADPSSSVLAHVPEAVRAHYPGVGQRLLDGCPQLVIAMVAAWRWELGDQYRVESGFTALG
ncbi:hypothetical protein [Streptomyces olivaceoviridis]